MARSVRHLTEIAAQLQERGIDLVVLKQGIDTITPAGRFTVHVLGAMDEMFADLISEGIREGLRLLLCRLPAGRGIRPHCRTSGTAPARGVRCCGDGHHQPQRRSCLRQQPSGGSAVP
jgi:hypothetical protein